MRVLVSGATGFLGRALTMALRREGHEVVAWARSVEGARAALGDQAEVVAMGDEHALRAALERCDALVNLAGEPVLSRWTAERRLALRASRVELTQRLVAALAQLPRRPRILVSGSAVGFYGDRGDEPLGEDSAGGRGFLPELCADWERAARAAEALGVRVVLLRTGVVLGLDGGALVTMLAPFRRGLGGRLASGRQHTPWIHVEDWARIACAALADERLQGPVNATAPEPVTNRELTRVLASVLGRSARFPVPAAALRLLFGGAASVLLESQRALPARLQALGFAHRFPGLEGALRDLLVNSRARVERVRDAREVCDSAYLPRHAPAYELRAAVELAAPREQCFAFFAAPENVGLLTPRALGLRLVARSGPLAPGATLEQRLRLGPLGLRWRAHIEAWQPPERFVDVQATGPYRCWWHEHRFEPRGAGTLVHERVLYRPPLGVLGRLGHRLLVDELLGDVFAQRALALRLRFGAAEEE